MNDLTKTRHGGRGIEQFDPERHRLKMAALDYSIEEAKRLQDWPTLETAIDAKIEEQRKFVAWWRSEIWRPGGHRGHYPRSRIMKGAENV